MDLTPLNIATTLAYDLCLAAGTHKPGLRLTDYRFYGIDDMQLPICDTCEVPITGRMTLFNLRIIPSRAA